MDIDANRAQEILLLLCQHAFASFSVSSLNITPTLLQDLPN